MEKIELLIPTLNEEEGIGKTVEEFPREDLESKGYEVEITIVDGESKDKTREIAREKGANVIIEKKPGYGRAYKTGFKESDADIIITTDADFTYGYDLVPGMVDLIEKGYDFVNTNRMVKVPLDAMELRNKIGNKILTLTAKILFDFPFNDSQSGMWVFRKGILNRLKLTSDGMPFSEEIKIEACKRGLKVAEYPIIYSKREGTRKLHPWRDGFKNLFFMFKKKWKYFSTSLSR